MARTEDEMREKSQTRSKNVSEDHWDASAGRRRHSHRRQRQPKLAGFDGGYLVEGRVTPPVAPRETTRRGMRVSRDLALSANVLLRMYVTLIPVTKFMIIFCH